MLHVAMREMRIWPQDAAKCCKNASKFFPDVGLYIFKANYNYNFFFKYYTFIPLYISVIFIVLLRNIS